MDFRKGDLVTTKPMRILGIDRHGNATLEIDGHPKQLDVRTFKLAELQHIQTDVKFKSISLKERLAEIDKEFP